MLLYTDVTIPSLHKAMRKFIKKEEITTLARCHTVKFRLRLEQNLPVHEVLLQPGAPLLATLKMLTHCFILGMGRSCSLVLHNIENMYFTPG